MRKLCRRDVLRGGALFSAGLFGSVALGSGVVFAQEGDVKRGGVLKLHLGILPVNFDTLSGRGSGPAGIVGACYNGLIRFHPQNPDEIVGDLAQDWERSEDGLVYTFSLRHGVRFHDGAAFTSADVRTTFDWLRAPPEGVVSLRSGSLRMIDRIEEVDEHTVAFHLKAPSNSFLPTLATAWMLVLPKHILEAEGPLKEKVVGTGPFKFKELVAGVSFEVERNPDYFDPDLPYLDGIIWYVVPSAQTATQYFQTGQLDMYQEPTPVVADTIEAEMSGVATVFRAESLSADSIALNVNRAPFDDVRVRRALSFAMDRDEAIQVIQPGNAVVGGLTPPGKWALSREDLAGLPGYGPDKEANRERARELLREAGHEGGLTFTLLLRQNAERRSRTPSSSRTKWKRSG